MSTTKLQIECACGSQEHTFNFLMEDDPDWCDAFLYIHLAPLPFWKRVVYAVKYIFGYKSQYGCFDEVVLKESDLEDLRKFFGKVQDVYTRNRTPSIPKEEWTPESAGSLQDTSQATCSVPQSCSTEVRHDRVPDGGEGSPAVPGNNPG